MDEVARLEGMSPVKGGQRWDWPIPACLLSKRSWDANASVDPSRLLDWLTRMVGRTEWSCESGPATILSAMEVTVKGKQCLAVSAQAQGRVRVQWRGQEIVRGATGAYETTADLASRGGLDAYGLAAKGAATNGLKRAVYLLGPRTGELIGARGWDYAGLVRAADEHRKRRCERMGEWLGAVGEAMVRDAGQGRFRAALEEMADRQIRAFEWQEPDVEEGWGAAWRAHLAQQGPSA